MGGSKISRTEDADWRNGLLLGFLFSFAVSCATALSGVYLSILRMFGVENNFAQEIYPVIYALPVVLFFNLACTHFLKRVLHLKSPTPFAYRIGSIISFLGIAAVAGLLIGGMLDSLIASMLWPSFRNIAPLGVIAAIIQSTTTLVTWIFLSWRANGAGEHRGKIQ